MTYTIPEEFYFRLHHVRPRFKGDIENVLIYMATEITRLGELPKDEFVEKINAAIRFFPGNVTREPKTINNWRTEISALFGFIITDETTKKPGLRAKELAENQDLVEAFKVLLYNFQYPGGHIKPHEVSKIIESGIKFKPAQFILKLLDYAEKAEGKRIGINKAELTHCVFNDLRCICDHEDIAITWERIKTNRENKVEYDWHGDIIRYAGDILDYMEIANLLKTYSNGLFYINRLEEAAVLKFINSEEWFSEYDRMINLRTPDISSINACQDSWFIYVNRDLSNTDFQTDLLAFIANNPEEYKELKETSYSLLEEKLGASETLATKEIGDMGESLVYGHECARVKIGGREDLIHLIKRIPTQFAVGYDIQSVEIDSRKRYIEVKTTISMKPINFNRVHLTTNEWSTAETSRERYFVYRLMLNKTSKKLFIMQNPVGLYKQDKIQMAPRDGADIVFDTDSSGEFQELITWKS